MLRVALTVILIGGGAQQAPLPTIQNGKIETRQATSLDREIAAAKAASIDPTWVAWRVPIADGQRGGCSTYPDDSYLIRGQYLENGPFNNLSLIHI